MATRFDSLRFTVDIRWLLSTPRSSECVIRALARFALCLVAFAASNVVFQQEADAQTECRAVRVVTEPGQDKDQLAPAIVSTVPGGDALGTAAGVGQPTELFLGLDSFSIPSGAYITSVTVYGEDDRTLSMTFRLIYALYSNESQTTYTSWASTNSSNSWTSATLFLAYLPSTFTYWLSLYVPQGSAAGTTNVHTVRVCYEP